MIQRNRYSIYVHLPNGEIIPLLPQTVAETFCKNQPPGGELESWQVQEMACALIHYLRMDLKRDAIELDELISALKELAAVCGFQIGTIVVETVASTDLYHLAQATGYGFELAFFQSVERSIEGFRSRNARLVRFVGLRACVKMLIGARNWCKKCQQMSDEIVAFIRSHMQQWSHEKPIFFAVS